MRRAILAPFSSLILVVLLAGAGATLVNVHSNTLGHVQGNPFACSRLSPIGCGCRYSEPCVTFSKTSVSSTSTSTSTSTVTGSTSPIPVVTCSSATSSTCFPISIQYAVDNIALCHTSPDACLWYGNITWEGNYGDVIVTNVYNIYPTGGGFGYALYYEAQFATWGYPIGWCLHFETPPNESSLTIIITNSTGYVLTQQTSSPRFNNFCNTFTS